MSNSTTFERIQAATVETPEPHTPGPFARYGVMVRDTVETVGGMFCIRAARAVKSVTGRAMVSHGDCIAYAYTRADADLMAAAPDMLHALRLARGSLLGCITEDERAETLAAIRAAIAAAEGRSNG